MTKTELALAIKEAYKIREESWIDMHDRYELDEMDAILKSFEKHNIDSDFAYPIYLGFNWMNDMLDWADEIIEGGDTK